MLQGGGDRIEEKEDQGKCVGEGRNGRAAARAIRDERSCTAASYARNLTQRDSRARRAVTGDREKMREGGVAKSVESPGDSIRVTLRLLFLVSSYVAVHTESANGVLLSF